MGIFKMDGGLFNRKKTDRSGECVVTCQQAEELRRSFLDVLDEIEDAGVEIDADELERRIRDIYDAFDIEEVSEPVANAIGENIRLMQQKLLQQKSNIHTCTQCGAPLKDGKCEYCGTNYN